MNILGVDYNIRLIEKRTVGIIGTGYVGLVTGACFAEIGYHVWCMDTDEEKIKKLKKGHVPIYEPDLEKLVRRNLALEMLNFTTDINDALYYCDMVFIAVGTPMGEDGSADLSHVMAVAKSIGQNMIHDMIIVNKSTVPVGTADQVKTVIDAELRERQSTLSVAVVSNPEFLKEGEAVFDFLCPDRVVIGSDSESAMDRVKAMYDFCGDGVRIFTMDVRSAEMTKYASNAMLATKISFINEIANICELVGADINQIRVAMGADRRIGLNFLYPGVGYGGSCLPKDVRALTRTAQVNGYYPSLLASVSMTNERQPDRFLSRLARSFGYFMRSKVFAIWGLSFKPGTDDMREAPSITVIGNLSVWGSKMRVYDPKAMTEAKKFYLKGKEGITYCKDMYDALKDADALIILTEWPEFRNPSFIKMLRLMKSPIIFDGRNIFDQKKVREAGFEYHQIGVAE